MQLLSVSFVLLPDALCCNGDVHAYREHLQHQDTASLVKGLSALDPSEVIQQAFSHVPGEFARSSVFTHMIAQDLDGQPARTYIKAVAPALAVREAILLVTLICKACAVCPALLMRTGVDLVCICICV